MSAFDPKRTFVIEKDRISAAKFLTLVILNQINDFVG